eukprot:266719-Chlamydomonas_euryale.AAC.10
MHSSKRRFDLRLARPSPPPKKCPHGCANPRTLTLTCAHVCTCANSTTLTFTCAHGCARANLPTPTLACAKYYAGGALARSRGDCFCQSKPVFVDLFS